MTALLIASLYSAFLAPPHEAKPWAYWWWQNTNVDVETIARDAADMRKLGFGKVLLVDSRGYWDDDNHVRLPPPLHVWGGEEWLDLVAEAIRACHREGLSFSLNFAASGGKLSGQINVGVDAPKMLVVKRSKPGERSVSPEAPFSGPVATFAVRTAEPVASTDWCNAGDGFYTMEGASGRREDGQDALARKTALEVRELRDGREDQALGEEWTILHFAWRTIPGHDTDVDVLDPHAVRRHLDRVLMPIFSRVPDLCGKDKTFTHIYSVSWEGVMPTWSPTFEADFTRFAGRELRPLLPLLAGFDLPGVSTEAFMRDFRRARGEMMRINFYTTMRAYAHEKNLLCYAESGGPWVRKPQVFGECDQVAFLAEMDVPQGEFWPGAENGINDSCRANKSLRAHVRGAVNAAHAYRKPLVAAEAFTHMYRHWSADPKYLKPLADQVYADGVNLLVWHTYTSSPDRFGVPGLEYFAGTHINRNVTWHNELAPFITYLGRCQAMLQAGEPVVDIAVLTDTRSYAHWGRYRDRVSNELPVAIPDGFSYDAINDAALAANPALLSRYSVVFDARTAKDDQKTVPVGSLLPDAIGPFTWCHRRNVKADWYFVAGEGRVYGIFRSTSEAPEIWDAITGHREAAVCERLADGRTKVALSLPKAGSCFVVFPKIATQGLPRPLREARKPLVIKSPWRVSFAYPKGIVAKPPKPRTMDRLVDFSTVDDLRHFSGTASYRTIFQLDEKKPGGTYRLRVGEFKTGLCRVLLNGIDCGVIWCDPLRLDVTAAIRTGTNELEIRYVNNWYNRLVGDCALPEQQRVTTSVLHYWDVPRRDGVRNGQYFISPTLCSGFTPNDKLQHCGLVGEVAVELAEERK